MNILLVRPPNCKLLCGYTIPPVSLLYLSSSLKRAGNSVVIVDLFLHDNDTSETFVELSEKIKIHKPKIIGFTCQFNLQFKYIVSYCNYLKKHFPDIKTIVGGMHPTMFFRDILEKCSCIDYVCIGEGDISFVELCFVIEKGDFSKAVPGIASRGLSGGVQFVNRSKYVAELDDLPMPSWHDVPFEKYESDYSGWHNPKGIKFKFVSPMITSRGCPFSCNFCGLSPVMGRNYRYHSPRRVVDEIELLYNEYGSRYFLFLDDNFIIKKDRIIEICKEIVKRGLDINFSGPTGIHVASVDEDVVDALASAGFLHAGLAIEHGSDYIRNNIIGKALPREKNISVRKII